MQLWSGLALASVLFASAGISPPEVELIGTASIPGDAIDLSGLHDTLAEGTPHNQFGSFGSAIAYTGHGDRYIVLNDRGPADGASEFRIRFHMLDIRVNPASEAPVTTELASTTLMSGPDERPLVGSIRPTNSAHIRYDPEGVRPSRTGTMWVSDEYGPAIDEFSLDGRWVRSLAVPDTFKPSQLAAALADEFPPHERRGRFPNRGFEGLAVAPDGTRLVAILQAPLIQDRSLGESGSLRGVNTRMLEVDCRTGDTRQWVYQLDRPHHGVSEILALDADRYLVLERDGLRGTERQTCAVFVIDTSAATDVSDRGSLPGLGLPFGVKPVSKTLFLDLTDPRLGIAGPSMPEKFEALTFGPDLPDGRRLLLVGVDNDMRRDDPTVIYAFAVSRSSLGQASSEADR